ncbi:MAG: hypothetical protein D6734_09555 [Candidatus Schekmanbacteria bacterium]|nr:MAG: hypothetical protein D6734_09555 [Candidatus Schekmanbacteria bacterium]
MNRKMVLTVTTFVIFATLFSFFNIYSKEEEKKMGKFAIILQAGKETHEGKARALHALMYALELKEKGHKVVLIFDGAGTEWIEALTNPTEKTGFESIYDQLKEKGVIEVICDFCATAFKVHKKLEERKISMANDFLGHPSISKWASQGYQIVVL